MLLRDMGFFVGDGDIVSHLNEKKEYKAEGTLHELYLVDCENPDKKIRFIDFDFNGFAVTKKRGRKRKFYD